MKYAIPYGPEGTLALDLGDARVEDCIQPVGQPLEDPAEAVVQALTGPLDYPPLAAATVPGDRVVLAVEPGLRQVEHIVAGALLALVDSGTNPRDISLVVGSNLRPPLALVPKRLRADLRVVLHNPADQEGLQYLAADKAARPIYLNRALCEADFLLPITTARLANSLGYVGGFAGLFPTFADLETQHRFQSPTATDHSTNQRRRREEADEAAWLLGIHFTMQVVPGAGDHLLHVVAGHAKAVLPEAQRLNDAAWLHKLAQKSSMAIAAIDGDSDQQTWENLARALHSAMQGVADGGVIALLTNVQGAPGPALAKLAGGYHDEELQEELQHEHTPDAHAAAMLADARERFDVYLLSGLEGDLVEGLGLGHVDQPAQIAKLATRQRSVLLLGSAQYAGCETPALVE